MTSEGGKGFLHDDAKLHKLCCEGSLKEVKDFVLKVDEDTLKEKLASREGVLGYTPLHEAAASGKANILDYLLQKTSDAHVNCRAFSGYTPLHLAANLGHWDCVKTLLDHTADISIKDEYGKTPKQIAELSSKPGIVQLLLGEEIIKEVETDGERLTELLKNNSEYLEVECLNRALIAATNNDNHLNIAKLVVKGAKNLNQCLELAMRENKPHARAMLLLIKAASTDNRAIMQKLFGETVDMTDNLEDQFSDAGFTDVQKAVLTGKVSMVVPIEIARRNGNMQLREELLLKTDVNQEEGYVYWHGLRLLQLEVSWLRRISWVKRLRLARNGFRSLPSDMGNYLKQVVKVDLQYNELSFIPQCLLELPSLGELNLNHNNLQEIPDVPEWSAYLTVLTLSHNQLNSLPINAVAPNIRSLNLSHNKFRTVPQCICSFVTLNSLDLSDNPDILTLPAEMDQLHMLTQLKLTNLKNLKDPPRNMTYNTPYTPDIKAQSSKEVFQEKEEMSTDRINMIKTPTVTTTNQGKLVFEIVLRVTCPKPPLLKVLLSELQDNTSLGDSDCCLEYSKAPGEIVKLQTQEHLDYYMSLSNKPQLYVSSPTNSGAKNY